MDIKIRAGNIVYPPFLCTRALPCSISHRCPGKLLMGKMHKKIGIFVCDITVILLYVHNLSTLKKEKSGDK